MTFYLFLNICQLFYLKECIGFHRVDLISNKLIIEKPSTSSLLVLEVVAIHQHLIMSPYYLFSLPKPAPRLGQITLSDFSDITSSFTVLAGGNNHCSDTS